MSADVHWFSDGYPLDGLTQSTSDHLTSETRKCAEIVQAVMSGVLAEDTVALAVVRVDRDGTIFTSWSKPNRVTGLALEGAIARLQRELSGLA